MVTWVYKKEAGIKFCFCLLLMILNLIGIYLVIELSGYDAMIVYSQNGGEALNTTQISVYLLFLVCAANLVFSSSFIIKRILHI